MASDARHRQTEQVEEAATTWTSAAVFGELWRLVHPQAASEPVNIDSARLSYSISSLACEGQQAMPHLRVKVRAAVWVVWTGPHVLIFISSDELPQPVSTFIHNQANHR